MLRVVSVSLGTSRRDYQYQLSLSGRTLSVARIGCHGDFSRAAQLLSSLDGKVTALGLGGVNLFYHLGRCRIPCPAGQYLASGVQSTPLVDGSGWKEAVEPLAVNTLLQAGIELAGKTALVVSVLDRYWLAEALARAGCRVWAGDAAFGLKLPVLLPFRVFLRAAPPALPLLARLPLKYLYPLGPRQERISRGLAFLYRRADIIAGNWHFIRRYLPSDLKGKIIVTAGTTPEDRRLLQQRGAAYLLSLSPLWGGISPSANVLEAVLTALGATQAGSEHLKDLVATLGWQPRLIKLH